MTNDCLFAVSMKRLVLIASGMVALFVTRGVCADTFVWTGAGEDALASNDANWRGGAKPTEMANVIFGEDGTGKDCTWDLDIPLASWLQTKDYGGTIMLMTTFESAKKAEKLFPALRVSGDCEILSGKWTHPNSENEQTYRIKAEIGGNLTLAAGASIDAGGCGPTANKWGPAGTLANGRGATHGGVGGIHSGTGSTGDLTANLYGSITEPTEIGWSVNVSSGHRGGGAVYLTVGGAFVHNGTISANDKAGTSDFNYGSCPGSVFVKCGTISGTGTITADSAPGFNAGGGGGRIAVVLTGQDANFANYDIVKNASAVSKSTGSAKQRGGSGTIYAETPANRKDHGWLIIKGNGLALDPCLFTRACYGDLSVCDYDKVTLTNAASLYMQERMTLSLESGTIDVAADSDDNGIYFCGGTVALSPVAEFWNVTCPIVLAAQTLPLADGTAWKIAAGGKVLVVDGVQPVFKGDVSILTGGAFSTLGFAHCFFEGDLSNMGTFSVGENAMIEFSGQNESKVFGSMDFVNFLCNTPGKTILFNEGDSFGGSKSFNAFGVAGLPVKIAGIKGLGQWKLDLPESAASLVQYVELGGCDASSSAPQTAYVSTDLGNNTNWTFDNTGPVNNWSGTSSSNFSDGANWSTGEPPQSGSALVVKNANPMVVDCDITFSSITLESGAQVTISRNVAVTGDVTVGDGTTLVWNTPGTIEGNLLVKAGGKLTHSQNNTTEAYRLDLSIAGDVTIEATGKIDADYMGYHAKQGPGFFGNQRASHGGNGAGNVVYGAVTECYGSIYCPTNCGSGGADNGNLAHGGGAIKLISGGTFTCAGSISANGEGRGNDGNYHGSGGSVWLSAANLVGAGTISVDSPGGHSGGGRIALYLTGSGCDFSGFTGLVTARGRASNCGTIYKQTAADTPGCGIVYVDGVGKSFDANLFAAFPSTRLCDPDEIQDQVKLSIVRKGNVRLTRDLTVESLEIETGSGLNLDGHTLKINSKKPKAWTDAGITYGGTEENPGKIIWRRTGLVLILK